MLNETEEILNVTTVTKTNTERLLPLLNLLKEPNVEAHPIDELKALLQAIVEILKHQNEALHRLESACATPQPLSN